MQEKTKPTPIDIASFRLNDQSIKRTDQPKNATQNTDEISDTTPSIFTFKYFKKIARNFKSYFEQKPSVNVLYVTNERKDHRGKPLYYMAITRQELIYEEVKDKNILRLMYLFDHDELKSNSGVIHNAQAKQKFRQRLKFVGKDIQEKHAEIFEA